MNKPNELSIRKFSLLALVGLISLIASNVFVFFGLNNDKTLLYFIGITQILGNLLLGIGLIGYFLHLKENRLLKWTSLFIGIFYILNLMAVESILPIVLNLLPNISSNLITFYIITVECIMVLFGISFMKLAKLNRVIGLFCLLFVTFSSITFVFNLFNVTINLNDVIRNFLVNQNINFTQIELISNVCKILSYSSLLMIFLFLYFTQKNQLSETFDVSTLSAPDPKELKKLEKELKQIEKNHQEEAQKES